MRDTDRLTPADWEASTGITIRDPDGWDRRNFEEDWAIPLTEAEFRTKAMQSTITDPKGFLR